MLKFPTCVGEVRRIILDQLGNRCHRRFATHWGFVRDAQPQRAVADGRQAMTRMMRTMNSKRR
jgi:hypothetical protein